MQQMEGGGETGWQWDKVVGERRMLGISEAGEIDSESIKERKQRGRMESASTADFSCDTWTDRQSKTERNLL